MMGAEPHSDPLIGRLIDEKFEIESLIGRGGMGAVYRARQKTLKRAVAIKVLRRELLDDPTYAARFKREAKQASQLDHPNLMRVIDFGEDDNLLYIAMELIDGKSLLTIMRDEHPLESSRIVDLLGQLLGGLAAMHDAGIVHRDLKPDNVMVVRGRDDDGHNVEVIKLCDFGISKQVVKNEQEQPNVGATHTATLTVAGSLVGTPDYMSPEQAKADPLDGRSDLYAVGVILYHMLAGRLPFRSSNSVKLLLAHINEKPTPPSKFVPTADLALEEICLHALAKSRDDRYGDAREMRQALREAAGLRDSAVLGRRLAPRASLPPPAASTSQRAAEPVVAKDTDAVPTKRAPELIESTGTLASRPEPEPSPSPKAAAVAPRTPSPAAPSTPPAAATNKVLMVIVFALLLVIVALLARK
jgi:eukaryotic-like serine/threonine-protein kinase